MGTFHFIKQLQALLLLALFSTLLLPCSSGNQKSESIYYDVESLKPVEIVGWENRASDGIIKPEEEGTPVRCYSCRCCDKMGMCINTNCCYGIKCHVLGKPPDMCFFLPLACNCDSSCPS